LKSACLWETYPDLAIELLDQSDGFKYSKGSNKVVFWICNLKHVWKTSINNRRSGKGCPYCSGNKVLVGFNDLWTTHPDTALMLKDPEDGFSVSSGSNRKLDWLCKNGHTVSVPPSSMVRRSVCSYCSNKKVLVGFNDLWTTDPDLAVQLLDQTDGYKYSRGSDQRKLWWVCHKNHVWNSTPNNRTGHYKTGCPKCFGRISKPELFMLEYLDHLHPESQRKVSWFFPDIYIERYKLFIEYDGSWFHKETLGRDEQKTNTLLELGYRVVRVREFNSVKLPDIRIKHKKFLQLTYNYKTDLSGLDVICEEILDWINIEKR